jgi:two-component system, OmpR family, phosphate regulon sensor histidine kinase PhoR
MTLISRFCPFRVKQVGAPDVYTGALTFRSSIFQKLLLAAALLLAVALGSADFLLTRFIAARERLSVRQEMARTAVMLARTLPAGGGQTLQSWAEAADRETGYRVTAIDGGGVVLADSRHDPESMENHARRPEVAAALGGRTGADVRRSATLDIDFSYFALPLGRSGGAATVLRLAVPLEQVGASIAAARRLILRASVFAMLIALLLAYFIARSFTRRVHSIQAYAKELVNADYSGTPAAEADDELGSVARSLRTMAEQFRAMLQRLSVESSRRETILSSMVEGVLAVDRNLRVIFCNDAFARAVHARTPLPDNLPLVHLVRDPALRQLLGRVISSGQPWRERMNLLSAHGSTFVVQAVPLPESGTGGAIATLHDITELERLERVRKDFVANISHELRTPLAAIRGYTETLLDGALEDPEHNRRFLGIVAAQADRLTNLTSDLLSLSEIEGSRTPLPAERVAVLESAENALRTVEAEAENRNVRAFLGRCENLFIAGQAFRLEQTLLNLLLNAIKYNQPGGEVRVEVGRAEDSVRISVCDTGIGIPADEIPRIFERFYRVDKARSRQTGGTGLGLSIVKHNVERMGGAITVESQLGKGSVFTLVFPAA